MGVGLLREGLDLPEVSLVAILDATRGLPAAEHSLIQTIGRAARHVEGGAAVCRQHDRLDGQGHLRNRATPGDPADLQREAWGCAHGGGQEGEQLDPELLGAVRKLGRTDLMRTWLRWLARPEGLGRRSGGRPGVEACQS